MPTKRRDLFVFAPAPGRADEAKKTLLEWLPTLQDHEGYLGSAVLSECAKEMVPDALVLTLEFESTEALREFWRKSREAEKKIPIAADGDDRNPADQGAVLFADTNGGPVSLNYDRGNGLLARLMHVHSEVAYEHTAATAN